MDLPEAEGNARFMDQPNLKMLYMDMKSREFTPQMMFTVGPSESCNLFARVVKIFIKANFGYFFIFSAVIQSAVASPDSAKRQLHCVPMEMAQPHRTH